eukprot:7214532-Pyramimonas_sp.AAC.1
MLTPWPLESSAQATCSFRETGWAAAAPVHKFCTPPPPPGRAQFSLKVETLNCTAWSSLQRWLPHCTSHIILIQEHHLRLGDEADRASSWAKVHGWQILLTPALSTPSGGTSAG